MSQKIYLPDCLANWKWERHLNPHYQEVKVASSSWLRGFNAFSAKAQDAYDRCDFNLLASLAYPLLDKDGLRTGCDLMNMFFVFDEYSDVSHESEVQIQADIIMDALRNPHKPRPCWEWVGGEITRQFWELAIKTASPQAQKRFIATFEKYTQSVVQQAADRTHCYVRSVNEYLEVRRDTIGAKPSFAILEISMDLPDEVVEHPVIQKLSILAIDMILLGNDIASYNLEQSRGDDNHNMVTIVMHQYGTDIAGAMSWIENYHKTLEKDFMKLYSKLPRWGGKIDAELQIYVDGIGNWVRASDQWGFESERYFGKRAPEIQRNRWVTLLPRKLSEGVGPEDVDDSQL